jgi:hypothetical protein
VETVAPVRENAVLLSARTDNALPAQRTQNAAVQWFAVPTVVALPNRRQMIGSTTTQRSVEMAARAVPAASAAQVGQAVLAVETQATAAAKALLGMRLRLPRASGFKAARVHVGLPGLTVRQAGGLLS